MDISKASSFVALALSVGGIAYSAGHLTSRVEALEKVDDRHDRQIISVDKEADVIRAQLAEIKTQQQVILNDLQWLRKHMERKEAER